MRISVTDLDSYLYWKSSEDMPLGDLLKRLRKEEEPTQQMLAGRAFHKVLEKADVGSLHVVEQDGYRFIFDLDVSVPLAPIRELKGEILIQTASGPVTLVGIVDGLFGNSINDHKLTERLDAERYADSYQWRSYLMMFDCRRFNYEAFTYRVDAKTGDYIVYDHAPIAFYRYYGMEDDVKQVISELAGIIRQHMPEAA